MNLEVDKDNNVLIDVNEILQNAFNLSSLDIKIPAPVNISSFLPPGFNYSILDDLNITLPNSTLFNNGSEFNLTKLLKGELVISLDVLSGVLNNTNLTKISIPIESTLNSLFNFTSNIPLAFRNNFTVIDGFDESYGKFGNSIGNVALIDCKHIKRLFHNTWLLAYEELLVSSPFVVLFTAGFDRQIRQ